MFAVDSVPDNVSEAIDSATACVNGVVHQAPRLDVDCSVEHGSSSSTSVILSNDIPDLSCNHNSGAAGGCLAQQPNDLSSSPVFRIL